MSPKITRTIIIVLLVNGMFAAGWWYVYSQVGHAEREADRLARAISAAEAKQDNIRTLSVFLSDIEADQKKLSGVFATRDTLVGLIEDIERLGRQSGTELTIESATLPQTADGFPSFRIRSSGSFAGLYRLAALLENSPYHISWDSVQFMKNEQKKNWSSTFQFQLTSFTQ
ncbi:MAG: hypothetical protein HYS44_04055 [Candidatus Niyogibacteria bacterium]|nr:hypothetical protein [Candidatus Niyogibacteria bacterium]